MTGTAVMAGVAVAGLGLSVYQTATAPGPPDAPSMAALPESKVSQVSKEADKQTANAIKSAKQRSGVATPNTLLTGSQGVADEELNLGGSRLI
jgi:hypothetical protein